MDSIPARREPWGSQGPRVNQDTWQLLLSSPRFGCCQLPTSGVDGFGGPGHDRVMRAQPLRETVGERLRRLRAERGLSQRDLAGPGVSYAYISRIEAGARRPSVKALQIGRASWR